MGEVSKDRVIDWFAEADIEISEARRDLSLADPDVFDSEDSPLFAFAPRADYNQVTVRYGDVAYSFGEYNYEAEHKPSAVHAVRALSERAVQYILRFPCGCSEPMQARCKEAYEALVSMGWSEEEIPSFDFSLTCINEDFLSAKEFSDAVAARRAQEGGEGADGGLLVDSWYADPVLCRAALLSLQSECEAYVASDLHTGELRFEEARVRVIRRMRGLLDVLPKAERPQWLTFDKIDWYAERMGVAACA